MRRVQNTSTIVKLLVENVEITKTFLFVPILLRSPTNFFFRLVALALSKLYSFYCINFVKKYFEVHVSFLILL